MDISHLLLFQKNQKCYNECLSIYLSIYLISHTYEYILEDKLLEVESLGQRAVRL